MRSDTYNVAMYTVNDDSASARTILIVEDERTLADALRLNLERQGFRTVVEHDGHAALRAVERHEPDLIVLDVMLPGLDGFEICRRIRLRSRVPIMMLTARGEEIDRVLGLEIGADDYLTKPFSLREFLARVRALLRRAIPGEVGRTTEEVGDLRLSISERRVWKDDVELVLAATRVRSARVPAAQPSAGAVTPADS